MKKKYGTNDRFAFYHSECFWVQYGAKAYELFKEEVTENPKEKGFTHKERLKYYKEIKILIEQDEDISPFKSHDVFGLNSISTSQWIEDISFRMKNI